LKIKNKEIIFGRMNIFYNFLAHEINQNFTLAKALKKCLVEIVIHQPLSIVKLGNFYQIALNPLENL
jgi:hypothetical protein